MSIRTRAWTTVITVGVSAFAVVSSGAPAQAARSNGQGTAPTPTYLTTTQIPDVSDNGLALDPSTGNVFTLTELEDESGGGEVDSDGPVTAGALADVPNSCDPEIGYCIVVTSPTGKVLRYVGIDEESEYMAVDPTPGRHRLYVSQYNDNYVGAPQKLAVVNLAPDTYDVQYFDIPLKYPGTNYQYDPEGVAVDPRTGIVYVGAKQPEVEVEEGGQGAILAFNGNSDTWLPNHVVAGDDPESTVFNPTNRMVYTANEDEGTLTVAPAMRPRSSVWDTTGAYTTSKTVFDPADCAGVPSYNPKEADKMAVDESTGAVFITDDLFRVAKIPAGAGPTLVGERVLKLSPNGVCPPSVEGQLNLYANNLAVAPLLSLLYVTSEQNTVRMVDTKTFKLAGSFTVGDIVNGVPVSAVHLEWPVINPFTNLFYISDEGRPVVFAYALNDAAKLFYDDLVSGGV